MNKQRQRFPDASEGRRRSTFSSLGSGKRDTMCCCARFPRLGRENDSGDRRREGVALVMVLGMIALLMMLAVAFSITMRVERSGAGSFTQMVASRQLVWAGLGAAIDDIDQSMASGSTNFIYPGWNVLPSTGAGDTINLAWGAALEEIPGSLQNEAQATASTWRDVATTEGVRSRIAYLVLNVSDMLDVEGSGGSNRLYGASFEPELQLDALPDVQNTAALEAGRALPPPSHYLSLREFNEYQDLAGGLVSNVSDNFAIGIESLGGALVNGVAYTNTYNIALPYADLDTPQAENEIVSRLQLAMNMGATPLSATEAKCIYTNLLDYVDTDSEPKHLAGPYVERVPMLNEVQVSLAAFRPAVGMLGIQIRVETLYPFLLPNPNSYEIASEVDLKLYGDNDNSTPVWQSDPANPLTPAAVDTGHLPGDTGVVYRTAALLVSANPGVLTNSTYKLDLTFRGRVKEAGVGTVVDEAPSPFIQDAGIKFSGSWTNTGGTVSFAYRSKEAIDARYNWSTTGQWQDNADPQTHSIGDENYWTGYMRGMLPSMTQYPDSDLTLHVSDAGRLFSAAELGWLVRSSSPSRGLLQTIRLADYTLTSPTNRADAILDYFSNEDYPGRHHGLVNPNTRDPDRLATAFRDMPLEPEQVAAPVATLSLAELTTLVDRFITWRTATNAVNRVDTPSELGEFDWRSCFPTWNDAKIETAIANSARQFSPRQNSFIILLAARPFSVGMGIVSEQQQFGEARGSRRAIVHLWRDPYPVETAPGVFQNRYQIRRFEWLGVD